MVGSVEALSCPEGLWEWRWGALTWGEGRGTTHLHLSSRETPAALSPLWSTPGSAESKLDIGI